MKRRLVRSIMWSVCVLVAVAAWTSPVLAQVGASASSVPTSSAVEGLQQRVFQLEVTQDQTVKALESSSARDKWTLSGFGVLLAALVGIQGFTAHREAKGVDQVSKIMDVVRQTLEARREAEDRARESGKELAEQAARQVIFDEFMERSKSMARDAHKALEEDASNWAHTKGRDDFKRMTDKLNEFARRFDHFEMELKHVDNESREFSAYVHYIRGLAAHYANDPRKATDCLRTVANARQREEDESQDDFEHRKAIANYYLGITESNFGDSTAAIVCFKKAMEYQSQEGDYLTKLAKAEALVMANEDIEKAEGEVGTLEVELKKKTSDCRGRLQRVYQRLWSRAALLRANMARLRDATTWPQEIVDDLQEVHSGDPQYYYVTATLAQVAEARGDIAAAKDRFNEAYDSIIDSRDLDVVREARSRVLLLMAAALCAKHGLEDRGRAIRLMESYLAEAEELLGNLPKRDSQSCTVFSVMSKRNEGSADIRRHLDQIRDTNDVLSA